DRGFASIDRIRELLDKSNQFFVLRIKNNTTLKLLDNGNCLIGTKGNQVEARVVNFCDLQDRIEFRLVTNLSESEFRAEDIGEIYRKRWGIETLWKFLKSAPPAPRSPRLKS
ncbi:transposase, partial [Anaplasma marginale]|uniref:transposase n=1 Tax=Anaplasma marginale TaxID=770 RepID=UPI00114527BC